jgi:hypothetical protein
MPSTFVYRLSPTISPGSAQDTISALGPLITVLTRLRLPNHCVARPSLIAKVKVAPRINRDRGAMRRSLPVVATLLSFIAFDLAAHTQPNARDRVGAYGVGCYWHRGQHLCNRYCYREVDGYWFCQARLRQAGSQTPSLLEFYPLEPYNRRRQKHNR